MKWEPQHKSCAVIAQVGIDEALIWLGGGFVQRANESAFVNLQQPIIFRIIFGRPIRAEPTRSWFWPRSRQPGLGIQRRAVHKQNCERITHREQKLLEWNEVGDPPSRR